jgi:hypothetical protein
MAIFSRWCMESKRSRKASGVVRSRLSPTISPLWASRRHRDGCACPRDPARLSSLGAPCYHSSWADSSFHSEPIWSSYTYCRPTGYCAGDRPSHLIFRELHLGLNCPKSLGRAHGVALRATEKLLWPISYSVFRPNSRLERYSNHFSDSLSRKKTSREDDRLLQRHGSPQNIAWRCASGR